MDLGFTADLFEWRGPAPHHFLAVPAGEAAEIEAVAAAVSYGYGMVPVTVQIGATRWTTALWPRAGGYVVPVKAAVRRAEGLGLGDPVRVRLTVVL